MAKRYWLKLHQGFLDTNEIAILEGEKEGAQYIVLWLRLLLMCLGKEEGDCGFLRLNENIPYDAAMIARVTRISQPVVESGIKRFVALGMMQILDDGTFYIEKIQQLIGKETDSADRVRKHRERKALQCNNGNVKLLPYKEKEEDKEKDKEKDKERVSAFTVFWTTYAKKDGYKKCLAKWLKIKPELYPTIFNHVVEYVKSTPDKAYRKNPLTYLNGEHWNDEIVMKTAPGETPHKTMWPVMKKQG